jgi:hypothetical protein
MLFHDWAHKFAADGDYRFGLKGYAIDALVVAPILFFALLAVALEADPAAVKATALAVAALSPVWVPLFILSAFWTSWIEYIRFQFWMGQEHVLLEVQLPPEVEKSPLAMELFLTTLWNSGGESTAIARLWKGQFRPIWSLEIASNEGRVSFYIHTRKVWRNTIEARLYGQYPEAKIVLAEDYVAKLPHDLEGYELWGTEYAKAQPGAVPIRTYIDYQLDKSPDTPEIQVDPIANILELFSHIGEGEYLWLQFIIKARKKDEWFGFYNYHHDHYKDGGKEAIAKMMKEAGERAKKLVGEDPEKQAQAQARGMTLLTESERQRVEAIEHAMSKLTFECGIRSVYIAKEDRFNGINNGSLVRLFDPVRSNNYNQINVTRGLSIFDYPWQDFRDIRKNYIKHQLFEYYKHRAYFYVPYDQEPVFMNTEEIATLWHFPNSRVQPPGLERVASKRAEAPANLPVGAGPNAR